MPNQGVEGDFDVSSIHSRPTARISMIEKETFFSVIHSPADNQVLRLRVRDQPQPCLNSQRSKHATNDIAASLAIPRDRIQPQPPPIGPPQSLQASKSSYHESYSVLFLALRILPPAGNLAVHLLPLLLRLSILFYSCCQLQGSCPSAGKTCCARKEGMSRAIAA